MIVRLKFEQLFKYGHNIVDQYKLLENCIKKTEFTHMAECNRAILRSTKCL